ncbi:hypothetical protein E3N88_43250 [Mikania micrantha]|uniref:Uncharacterized protein n=1 Tax=Mikania micrantha TaxID=192012 RepID=A0A5N6LHP6_9ASTR|nr:hypothetical protein E3N88_43250 [Mikania micrantha]
MTTFYSFKGPEMMHPTAPRASGHLTMGFGSLKRCDGGWFQSLRATQPDEAPSSLPERIARDGSFRSGVPPGPYVRPNMPILLFWAHSRPFLDCRASFERRLDSMSQLLAIIDL